MEAITLPDLEQAINFWRGRRPSEGDERKLSAEVDALADIYGLMIATRQTTYAVSSMTEPQRKAFISWQSTTVTQ